MDELLAQATSLIDEARWEELAQAGGKALSLKGGLTPAKTAAALVMVARGALEQGHYLEAQRASREATAADSRNAEAYSVAGWAYWSPPEPDLTAAEAAFHQDLALRPGEVSSLSGLAAVAITRGQLEEARRLTDQVVAGAPNSKDALWAEARLAYAQKDYVRAEQALRRVIQAEPRNMRAYLDLSMVLRDQRRFAEARQMVGEARKLDPGNVRIVLEEANIAYFQRDYEGTLAIVDPLLKQDPRLADALYLRAWALHVLGRETEALAAAEQLIATGAVLDGQVVKAYALAKTGQRAEALALVQSVLRQDPLHGDAQSLVRELGGQVPPGR